VFLRAVGEDKDRVGAAQATCAWATADVCPQASVTTTVAVPLSPGCNGVVRRTGH